MRAISKLFCLICVMFLLGLQLTYENYNQKYKIQQLELDNHKLNSQILEYTLYSEITKCSALGFCVGDYVELNSNALVVFKSNQTYGRVKKIEGNVIFFDDNNDEEWKKYDEMWLKHRSIIYYGEEIDDNYTKTMLLFWKILDNKTVNRSVWGEKNE